MNLEFFFEIQRNINDSPKKNIKIKERTVIPQRNMSNSKKETWFPNAGHVSPRGFSYRLLDFLLVTRRVTSKFTNGRIVQLTSQSGQSGHTGQTSALQNKFVKNSQNNQK